MANKNKVINAYRERQAFKLPGFMQNLVRRKPEPLPPAVEAMDFEQLTAHFVKTLNPEQKMLFGRVIAHLTIYSE